MALTKTLVCRRCQVLPELVREEGHREVIRCPRCGVFGDYETVRESARVYAARELAQGEVDRFRHRLARSVCGSKNIRYIRGNRRGEAAPVFIFR